MKRTRRVSLHIERREVSITLTINEPGSKTAAHPLLEQKPNPPNCTVCGAAWISVSPPATTKGGFDYTQVASAFVQGGLHPPLYLGGKLWVCSQTVQQLKLSKGSAEPSP